MTDGYPLPDFPEVFDSSMRSAFVSCPRSWLYGYLMSLRKAGQSIHLHFGGTLAKGLETVRRAYWQDGLDEIHAISAGLHEVIRAWGDFEMTDQIASSRAGVKSLDACLDALYSYFEYFPLGGDQITPVMIDGEPLVEKSFALPLPGTKHPITGDNIIFCGRFDLVGRFNDAVFIVDEKTTGSLGASWRTNWPMRGQISAYCWGARSFGLDVAGAIIRGVGILKGSIQFEQVVLSRPDWFVDQWIAQAARDINRAAEMWTHAKELETKTGRPFDAFDQAFDSACSSYGGCGYQLLCESENPDNWFGDYVVSPWNPLHREGDIP